MGILTYKHASRAYIHALIKILSALKKLLLSQKKVLLEHPCIFLLMHIQKKFSGDNCKIMWAAHKGQFPAGSAEDINIGFPCFANTTGRVKLYQSV